MNKKLKIIGVLSLIIVFAFTLAACDNNTQSSLNDVEETGDLIVTADLSEIEEDDANEVGVQSVVENRFNDYIVEITAEHQGSGRIKSRTTDSEYTFPDSPNFKFDSLLAGNWDVTIKLIADYDYDGDTVNDVPVATEEFTATITAGETTTVDPVTVGQNDGHLDIDFNLEDNVNEITQLELRDINDNNNVIKSKSGIIDKSTVVNWEDIFPKQYELFVEIQDSNGNSHDLSKSVLVIPGMTRNVTVKFYEGTLDLTVGWDMPPTSPTNLSLDGNTLKWDATEADSFNIVRTEWDTNKEEIIEKGITTADTNLVVSDPTYTYTDESATEGIPYVYKVVAVKDELTSDYSEPIGPGGVGVEIVTNEAELDDALTADISTIILGNNLELTTAVDINRDVVIEGAEYSINAGINILNGAEVKIKNLTVEEVGDKVADLSSSIEDIIIGVRSGALTANNITITESRGKDGVNFVGVGVQGGQTLNLKDSTITLTDTESSLVYGVYAQPGAIATIDNNSFELKNERRTLGVGIELAGSINNNISVSSNTMTDNTNGDQYNLQVYNGGNEIEETVLHDWVETLINIETGEKAYIYNDFAFYAYPPTYAYNLDTGESFDTIQAAVTGANDNETIIIGPGTYDGFNLTKGLSIKGVGDVTVEAGNVSGETKPTAIFVQTNADVNIENITFDGSSVIDTSLPNGILTSTAYDPTVNINDCVFNNFNMGIYFNPDASGTITNNTFDNNEKEHCAIGIDGIGSVSIEDNEIDTVDIGLEIFNPNATWSGNTFGDNVTTNIDDQS